MDHIAILNKKWNLLSKILSSEKTIESRWYKSRFAPWDRIKQGDKVYFKNSGGKVEIFADVSKVLQFRDLDKEKIKEIINQYGEEICLSSGSEDPWYNGRKYCILVFIENVTRLENPFDINKNGFGNACAWLCVKDINEIKV